MEIGATVGSASSFTSDVTTQSIDIATNVKKSMILFKPLKRPLRVELSAEEPTLTTKNIVYLLYEGSNVVFEVNENGDEIAHNVYGTNLLQRNTDGEAYFYLYNAHGDVTEGGVMNLEIIYEEDTELADYEALNRGQRGDVVVIIGDKKYKVYIISMIRLQQDFEMEQKDSGYYMAEANTLIVKEVTKKEIEYTIAEMYKCNFFERLDNNGF